MCSLLLFYYLHSGNSFQLNVSISVSRTFSASSPHTIFPHPFHLDVLLLKTFSLIFFFFFSSCIILGNIMKNKISQPRKALHKGNGGKKIVLYLNKHYQNVMCVTGHLLRDCKDKVIPSCYSAKQMQPLHMFSR